MIKFVFLEIVKGGKLSGALFAFVQNDSPMNSLMFLVLNLLAKLETALFAWIFSIVMYTLLMAPQVLDVAQHAQTYFASEMEK